MNYQKIIAERIKLQVDMELETLESLIEIPPKPEMGDFALPCFQFSKFMRKAPNIIAEELSKKIEIEVFEKIQNLGPYINFFVDKSRYTKNTMENILNEKDKYGSSKIGDGKTITIEYSSPKVAKPFHVEHLISTVIGNSLYKIFSFEGYNCIRINHLGDFGTQFGKLILAYKRWCDEKALEKEPIKELLRIYVKFHDEAEKDPSLENEARNYFKKLENREKEEVALWNKFRNLSLKEFKKVYEELNVEFDSYNGKSFYSDKMSSIVNEMKKKGLLVESNGVKVVMLDEYNMPPCIIQKSDGASIYATIDIAAAEYRKKTYNFDKSIYVVGLEQSLHFKQFFKTLELAGYEWAKNCEHVGFGPVRFSDRKFSTSKGEVVFIENLLKKAILKAKEIISEKNPNLENKEEIAKKVGIGSILFTCLKNGREKDIVFNWNEILSFEGETGLYVQYTYARAKKILRKAGVTSVKANYKKLGTDEEFKLAKKLQGFNDAIISAMYKLEPFVITRYVIDVAKAFNKFYNSCNIINAEDGKLKNARLAIVEATSIVIKNALHLLGIETVEKM